MVMPAHFGKHFLLSSRLMLFNKSVPTTEVL